MPADNGPYPNRYENTDSHLSHCDQLSKPDKIVTLERWKFQHKMHSNLSTRLIETELVKRSSAANVIPFAKVVKSAELIRSCRLKQARFSYPMLECS